MTQGSSGPGPARLPAPEAVEIARTFEENPVDGSALLRLCAHHLAAGEHVSIREALATHLSAASGGSKAVRLRIAQAGELLPEQRAELLVDLSHVEGDEIGDLAGAVSSVKEALQTYPSLAGARRRFEEVATRINPAELAPEDRQLLESLEDEPVTDPGFKLPDASEKAPWGSSGRMDPDFEATVRIPVLSRLEPPPPNPPVEPDSSADDLKTGAAGSERTAERKGERRGKRSKSPDEAKADVTAVVVPDTEAERTDPGKSERAGADGDGTGKRVSPYQPDPVLARQCESLSERDPKVALGALAALERSCTRDIDRALVHRFTGKIHESLGQRDRAFSSLARAATLAPPDRSLLDEMFRLAVMTGAYAELASAYTETLRFSIGKPDRIYIHLKLGHLNARELSRPKEAIDHYRKVMSLDPHNVEALRRLGELLAREERWNEVVEIKHRELETVWLTTRDIGRAAAVKRELARLYEENLGDRHRALLLYRELLDLTPGNPAAIANLERLGQETSADETSRQAFETLADLYRRQGAYTRLADLLSQHAREILKKGEVLESAARHREAARTYEDNLTDPGRAFIELVRAVQILPQGDSIEADGLDPAAVAEITDAIFADLLRTGRAAKLHEQLMTVGEDLALRVAGSKGASFLVRLVDAELEDLGDVARAAARLARAVDLSGNDPGLEARLEGLYVSRGAWSEVSAFYKARAERTKDAKARSELLFRLAEILEDELGDIDGATAVYEEIIDLDGGNPDALAALCRLLEETRNWTDLVEALERAVTVADSIENKKAALLKRARVYLEKLQNPDSARADWQRVLALDPHCVDALQGMAETASESGDARETAGALEASLSGMRLGEPGRSDGYRKLARLAGDVLKQPAKARLAWEELLREEPEDDEAFERLQTIYRDRGDLEPLARLLGERLRQKPHSTEARRWRRERIDALEKLGRGEEAGEEWWYAAQADPTDLEAHARLTAFHTARRNWKVVVRVLDDWLAAVTTAADKAELYVRIAEVHRHQFNDDVTAVAAYEKALARVPEHAGAQTALLEIYRERDDLKKMMPLLEARLRWATEPRERTQALAELWEVGRRLGEQGDDQAGRRALEALKEACLLAPGDTKLWEALEEVLSTRDAVSDLAGHQEARAARQEGADRAVSLFKAAEAWKTASGPGDERSRERVRRCLERARDAAPADHPVMREILGRLREIYTDVSAWEALAGILGQLADAEVSPEPEDRKPILEELAWLLAERLGRPMEAVGHLETLLDLATRDTERDAILGRMVTLHGGLGDWHRVLALTEERVSMHRGTDREADLHLAAAEIAERRIANFEAAIGHLRAALAVRPGDEDTLVRLERVCVAAGRHGDHAAIVAEEGRRMEDPGRRAALLVRAAAIKEERLGDPAGARRDLESVLATEGLLPETALAARNGLARILLTLRAYDDLARLYEALIEDEQDPEAKADLWVALGLIHEEQRKSAESAIAAYRAALETDPENTAALDAVARISEAEGDLDTALEMRTRQAEVAWLPAMRAELLCSAARIHERRKQSESALSCYERACEIDPTSSRALRGRLRMLRELDRGDEALKTARSLAAIAEEPDEIASLWAAVGEGLEAEGDMAGARQAFEKAVAAVPDNGVACASLARMLLVEGKPAEALSLLEKATERLERENDTEGLADVHRQAAAAHEALGRSEDARRKLYDAYRLGPTRRGTLEALALHFSSRQDPVRTHEILCTLLEHHEEDLSKTEKVSILRRQGLALAAMGRGGDAAKKLHEALAVAPRDRDVLVALSGIYEETGRWAEVVELKRKLLDLARGKRDQRRLSLEIADLFAHRLHDAANAARVLSQALETHPDDAEILARLAEEQEKRGSFHEAADCLERIVGTAPDGGRTRLWVKLGRLRHERLDAPVRALLAYRRGVEAALDEAELEHALTAVRDLVAATRDARPLAEILSSLAKAGGGPGHPVPTILRELAEVLRYQLGDRAGAIESLEQAVSLEPDDIPTIEDLARLYEREGRDDEAVQALRKVLSVSPFDLEAYRALLRVLKRRKETDGAALVASLLVLLDEADGEIEWLSSSLGKPPIGGRHLPDGPATSGLIHRDASGPIAGLFAALGHEALAPFSSSLWGNRSRVLSEDSGPFADRSRTAVLLAARAFGLPEPEIGLGPSDMSVLIAPEPSGRPGVIVSSAVADGTRSLATPALKFLAGRAVFSTLPQFIAARVLDAASLQSLLSAALLLTGLETEPNRETTKLAKKLERAVSKDRSEALSSAAGAYKEAGPIDLGTFVEGVGHTVVRAGLLLCGSPEVAARILKEEGSAGRAALRELVRFTISDEHLELRRHLGWGHGLA